MRKRHNKLLKDRDVAETLAVTLVTLLLSMGGTLLVAWARVVYVAVRSRQRVAAGRVLVFGHRLDQGGMSGDFRDRLDELARLMRADARTTAIILGGGTPSEARVGQDYLVGVHGVAADRVRLEEDSTDTLENLRQARSMLEQLPGDGPLVLLSSRYHLARLGAMAGSLGFDYCLHPAEQRPLPGPRRTSAFLLEGFLLCWFTTGKIWAALTGKQRMLDRIR